MSGIIRKSGLYGRRESVKNGNGNRKGKANPQQQRNCEVTNAQKGRRGKRVSKSEHKHNQRSSDNSRDNRIYNSKVFARIDSLRSKPRSRNTLNEIINNIENDERLRVSANIILHNRKGEELSGMAIQICSMNEKKLKNYGLEEMDKDNQELLALKSNDSETLNYLAKSNYMSVRAYVAANEHTSRKVLEILTKDVSPFVKEMLIVYNGFNIRDMLKNMAFDDKNSLRIMKVLIGEYGWEWNNEDYESFVKDGASVNMKRAILINNEAKIQHGFTDVHNSTLKALSKDNNIQIAQKADELLGRVEEMIKEREEEDDEADVPVRNRDKIRTMEDVNNAVEFVIQSHRK